MEKLCQYLLRLVAAGMLAALLQSILQSPRLRKIAALASGAVLLLTALSPLMSIEIDDIDLSLELLAPEAASIEQMQTESTEQINAIIKRTTEEYIMDKAAQVGAVISAEVTVADTGEGYSAPSGVTIAGSATAVQKRELSQYMEQELGIPAERQVWKTI